MNFELINVLKDLNEENEIVENHSDFGLIVKDLGNFLTELVRNADWFTNAFGVSKFDTIKNLKVEDNGDSTFLIY